VFSTTRLTSSSLLYGIEPPPRRKDFQFRIRIVIHGNYESIVWDLGTYEVVEGSVKKGDVGIYLTGRKLDGELSLRKLDDKNWRVLNSGMVLKEDAASNESALTMADVPAKRSKAKAVTKKESRPAGS
jgi:hypothetical protein